MDLDFSAFSNFNIGATIDWLNSNTGVLALSIFIATLVFGWTSGIFTALMRKPRFTVRLIDGPTFSCTFTTGRKHGEFDEHQTGIALYLDLSNVGSAPSSISSIEIGYHWHVRPFSKVWLKYRIGWFWLTNQSVSLVDFQAAIGESIKVYPFLTQTNQLASIEAKTYLRIGESTNGVVYFEQRGSWGGCFPTSSNGFTKIKLRIRDAHGRCYISKHRIPVMTFEEAKKFNPRFGETHAELQGESLTTDLDKPSKTLESDLA